MELEEMKATWELLSKRVEKQEKLTNQMTEKMTEQHYRTRLNKIAYPEITGTIICFIAALLLAWNFNRLDQMLMRVFGGLSIAYLLIAPIASLTMIKGLKRVNISSVTYYQTIQDYLRKKIRFQKFQKLNVFTGFAFMAISFPVLLNMMRKDVTDLSPYFWTIICPAMIVLYFVFSRWVLTCYNKVLKAAEEELSDINS